MNKLYAVILIALMLAGATLSYTTVGQVQFTVEEKERINSKEDSKYLIFTDKGVFENTDSLMHLKFNSSDLYGKLKVGESYRCKKNFWRVSILSMYPNLLSCTKA